MRERERLSFSKEPTAVARWQRTLLYREGGSTFWLFEFACHSRLPSLIFFFPISSLPPHHPDPHSSPPPSKVLDTGRYVLVSDSDVVWRSDPAAELARISRLGVFSLSFTTHSPLYVTHPFFPYLTGMYFEVFLSLNRTHSFPHVTLSIVPVSLTDTF